MWFPAVVLPGAPLWGFTYRLLVDWLRITPSDHNLAGYEVARRLLDFLLTRGLTLHNTWQTRTPHSGNEPTPVQIAQVTELIPVARVLDHLATPGRYVGQLNAIEVTPEYIRVHGLSFEQYLIESISTEKLRCHHS